MMLQDHQNIQKLKANRGNDEKVHRGNARSVVPDEGRPTLGKWAGFHQVNWLSRSGAGMVCWFNPLIIPQKFTRLGVHLENAGLRKVESLAGDGAPGGDFASFLLAN